MSGAGVADLFHLLESNKLCDVDEIKKVFHEHFLSTKDNWLVNGLFDYYLSTNSLRAVEVLGAVREPHDKHLLDRLAETLAKPGGHGPRLQALTLLGHIARRQPTWLHKLANHALFKELLKLLKADGDELSLMSALLLLVTLLPMLPAALGPYIHEIFEVFGRLASYHRQRSSSLRATSTSDDRLYLLHFQIGLYSLFHRLYALYPCNFIAYLRLQYAPRDQNATFSHTVRPMLESVRMHPLLVTASKDQETNAARWKKMEHHDVIAECGRFALDRAKDGIFETKNSSSKNFTPLLLEKKSRWPFSIADVTAATVNTGPSDDDNFWSPSMACPPRSPPGLQPVNHDLPRSAPSTPNNNNSNTSNTANSNNNNTSNTNSAGNGAPNLGPGSNGAGIRSNSSPPEAAVEATPETTPVKDGRQASTRAIPAVGSSAVRALGALGNGALGPNSRPSTPTGGSAFVLPAFGFDENAALCRKMNRLVAEQRSVAEKHQQQAEPARVENLLESNENGKNDSSNEDQEVLEIVGSQSRCENESSATAAAAAAAAAAAIERANEESARGARADLSRKVQRLRFHSQCQFSASPPKFSPLYKVRRSKSCPGMKIPRMTSMRTEDEPEKIGRRLTEETGTQTCAVIPYEHLLVGILSQGTNDEQQQQQQDNSIRRNSDSRLSPSSMLDRYIEACARFGRSSNAEKSRGKSRHNRAADDSESEEDTEERTVAVEDSEGINVDSANQQLQLMQMQLQFERQRREVHAERNRRLLGKLRDSRALEEHNSALTDRLRIAEKEIDCLRNELDRGKKESRAAEERYTEALRHWQSKCVEEQQRNRTQRARTESLELELKNERLKVAERERESRAAESAFFDAAHQLKGALKAASRAEELKRLLDNVQKRFLLLGEAQTRLQERSFGPVPMARQEAAQIQRSFNEELSNLRRQLDSRGSLIEALRVRLIELETREARKEAQLADEQRLLREAKERHEYELKAVESKYKSQVEINLLLEGRILELHGYLEVATSAAAASKENANKERSPPLSASLASSSEASLSFRSGSGFMSESRHSPAQIPNLQAIVEPALASSSASSSRAATPSKPANREA